MTKQMQQHYRQRLINQLNYELDMIEIKLSNGAVGTELQLLESNRARICNRLAQLYGTQKYGLIYTT